MLRRAVTASIFLISFAALALAQDKPNLTGTWKLNITKSDFGAIPGPDSQTLVIEHTDPAVKIVSSQAGAQGSMDATINFTTDGKEASNNMGGRDVKSTSVWDGRNLVMSAKFSLNDQDVTIKSVWTLSDDGKTISETRHLASPMGETDQKLIFEKQEAGASTPTPTTAQAAPAKPIVTPSATGPKPNLSGVWKLIPAKSDFGVMPGPDSRTDTIDHTDPQIKLSRKENGPNGALDYTLNMSTDGKEVNNDLGQAQARITGAWEGPALVLNTKLKMGDQDIGIRQVLTMSDDGKTLTSKAHLTSAMGEMDTTEVYEKQP